MTKKMWSTLKLAVSGSPPFGFGETLSLPASDYFY
jgi:hypothetical protein